MEYSNLTTTMKLSLTLNYTNPRLCYCNNEKMRYEKLFPTEEFSDEQKTTLQFKTNQNLISEFYDPDFAKHPVGMKCLSKKDLDELENLWKTRILCENSPNGLIIMTYNPRNHVFNYHSSCHIPMDILDACAMKYVRVFGCRDLFINNAMFSLENYTNKILKNIEQEDKKQSMEFLHHYKPSIEKWIVRTRFSRIGGISTKCDFFQSNSKKQEVDKVESKFKDETKTVTKQSTFSYMEYKKMKNEKLGLK